MRINEKNVLSGFLFSKATSVNTCIKRSTNDCILLISQFTNFKINLKINDNAIIISSYTRDIMG